MPRVTLSGGCVRRGLQACEGRGRSRRAERRGDCGVEGVEGGGWQGDQVKVCRVEGGGWQGDEERRVWKRGKGEWGWKVEGGRWQGD